MKKHLLFLALFNSIVVWSTAQVTQLNESFTSPFNPLSNGWFMQNNSNPIGNLTWAQGIGTVFPAYSGSSNDYIQNNFDCQGSGSGSISDFLITPTLSLMNGGVFQFYTRTVNYPATYPDRLELRMSIGTGTGSIPNSLTAVGTFTNLLLTINPNLSSTGYPGAWTLYTTTLSGISGTVTGRFAFRYNVSNGGLNGANSAYIGIDNVLYTTSNAGPCPPPPITISPKDTTICIGQTIPLIGSGASTYTWVPSNNHNTMMVIQPSSSQVYTLNGKSANGCFGSTTATVTVVSPPMISAPSVSACPDGTVQLNAFGATTYTWSNGMTGSSIVVSTNGPTVYQVVGETAPGCQNYQYCTIYTNTFLTVSNSSITACPNQTLILGASGANSYTWSTGANSPSIVVTPTNNQVYTVSGSNGNCTETKHIGITIDPNLFAPSFTTCAGTSATLLASGANTYSWSTGSTSSVVVVSPTSFTTYTITGTSGLCSQTKTVSVTIGNNLSVNCSQVCLGSSLLLSAYGASSYTWLPINDFNASVIVTPTAATVYTLVGASGTCKGTKTIQVTYCASVGEPLTVFNENMVVYPNPFSDELTISGAEGQLKIVNLFGQIIHEGIIQADTQINTSEFGNGLYFVIVTYPGTTQRKVIRVVKN